MDDRHAWEEPGAHEVAPGVYRIPLPLPGDHLKAVNVYAIADGERTVLVDGGWALAEAAEQLTLSLDKIGFGLGDIREFLVTHVHRDHYTQAVAVRRTYGTSVALGEGERVSLDAMRTMTVNPMVPALAAAGAPELSERVAGWHNDVDLADWDYPDRWLTHGVELPLQTRTLQVFATPGHTRGHVVFHDPAANLMFAGDHVLPHITPSIGLQPSPAESPLHDYLSSLQLMLRLPDTELLPAHGPTRTSTHARVEELLAHHERRLTATAEAVEQGSSTGFEAATRLGWTRHERRLDELDLFNQAMAVRETVAHLYVLVERGWLRRSIVDGVEHFTRA